MWQPIETAPKDETPVLIKHANNVAIAVRNDTIFGGWQCCVSAQLFSNGWEGHTEYYGFPNPTHWMPLPEIPNE